MNDETERNKERDKRSFINFFALLWKIQKRNNQIKESNEVENE